jgi:hypothetical protein
MEYIWHLGAYSPWGVKVKQRLVDPQRRQMVLHLRLRVEHLRHGTYVQPACTSGLKRTASLAADGRRIRCGMRSDRRQQNV